VHNGVLPRGVCIRNVVRGSGWWQLNAVADAGLEVTGEFDESTLRATQSFQEEHGLEVDGQVGPLTLWEV